MSVVSDLVYLSFSYTTGTAQGLFTFHCLFLLLLYWYTA